MAEEEGEGAGEVDPPPLIATMTMTGLYHPPLPSSLPSLLSSPSLIPSPSTITLAFTERGEEGPLLDLLLPNEGGEGHLPEAAQGQDPGHQEGLGQGQGQGRGLQGR